MNDDFHQPVSPYGFASSVANANATVWQELLNHAGGGAAEGEVTMFPRGYFVATAASVPVGAGAQPTTIGATKIASANVCAMEENANGNANSDSRVGPSLGGSTMGPPPPSRCDPEHPRARRYRRRGSVVASMLGQRQIQSRQEQARAQAHAPAPRSAAGFGRGGDGGGIAIDGFGPSLAGNDEDNQWRRRARTSSTELTGVVPAEPRHVPPRDPECEGGAGGGETSTGTSSVTATATSSDASSCSSPCASSPSRPPSLMMVASPGGEGAPWQQQPRRQLQEQGRVLDNLVVTTSGANAERRRKRGRVGEEYREDPPEGGRVIASCSDGRSKSTWEGAAAGGGHHWFQERQMSKRRHRESYQSSSDSSSPPAASTHRQGARSLSRPLPGRARRRGDVNETPSPVIAKSA